MEQIEISEKEYERLKKAGGLEFSDIYGCKYIVANNVVLKASVTLQDELDKELLLDG